MALGISHGQPLLITVMTSLCQMAIAPSKLCRRPVSSPLLLEEEERPMKGQIEEQCAGQTMDFTHVTTCGGKHDFNGYKCDPRCINCQSYNRDHISNFDLNDKASDTSCPTYKEKKSRGERLICQNICSKLPKKYFST